VRQHDRGRALLARKETTVSSIIGTPLTPAEVYEYAVPAFFGPCVMRLLDVAKPKSGNRVTAASIWCSAVCADVLRGSTRSCRRDAAGADRGR
jgi:hypothetical protein